MPTDLVITMTMPELNREYLIDTSFRVSLSPANRLRDLLHDLIKFHIPQEITLPNGEWGVNCNSCDGWVYPCATIEIISKGLKKR